MLDRSIRGLALLAGLCASNFMFQYVHEKDYELAFERSIFQAIAVLGYWLAMAL